MKARSQSEHEAINRREYPGTRQLCERCGDFTERCEEDAIYTDGGEGPLCAGCYDAASAPAEERCKASPSVGCSAPVAERNCSHVGGWRKCAECGCETWQTQNGLCSRCRPSIIGRCGDE